MFNKIDGDFDDVAIRTFKVSLLAEHGLRKSLTGKPANSVINKRTVELESQIYDTGTWHQTKQSW